MNYNKKLKACAMTLWISAVLLFFAMIMNESPLFLVAVAILSIFGYLLWTSQSITKKKHKHSKLKEAKIK